MTAKHTATVLHVAGRMPVYKRAVLAEELYRRALVLQSALWTVGFDPGPGPGSDEVSYGSSLRCIYRWHPLLLGLDLVSNFQPFELKSYCCKWGRQPRHGRGR